MPSSPSFKKKPLIYNVLFVIVTGAVLLFLLNAPEETTPKLPRDDNHAKFFDMASKKEAEKYCAACHNPDGMAPLPEKHTRNIERCLFCHKRT